MLLGNLTTKQLQERLGITLQDNEETTLESMRQNNAQSIAKDKWHCFDIPLTMLCGSIETATKICEILKPYSKFMKEQLQISIEQ
jgi:hypothetical protein